MAVEGLKDLLQNAIDDGKGDYIIRSSEFEYHEKQRTIFM